MTLDVYTVTRVLRITAGGTGDESARNAGGPEPRQPADREGRASSDPSAGHILPLCGTGAL